MRKDRGSGASSKDDVANNSKTDGDHNCLVATEVGVGNPGAEERADVAPEREESPQTSRSLLALSESTRVVVRAAAWVWSSSSGSQEVSLDEILNYQGISLRWRIEDNTY